MNKNKFFGVALSFLFLSYLVGVPCAYAAEAQIAVSSATADAGEEVSISVSISNNPGIAAFKLILSFDKNRLTPVSIQKGSAVTTGNILSNMDVIGTDISDLSFVTAFWYNMSNNNADGVLFTVKFKIKANAFGSIPLTLSYDPGEICNKDGEYIYISTKNSTIKVNRELNVAITGQNLTAQDATIHYNVVNSTSGSHDVLMALTVFDVNDASGQALFVAHHTKTVASGNNNTGSFSNIRLLDLANTEYVFKILCWDSLYNMVPLCEPSVLKLN